MGNGLDQAPAARTVVAKILHLPNWLRWSVTVAFFLTLNWLMLAPASSFEGVPDLLPYQDKIVHLGLFLALGILVRWTLEARLGSGGRRCGVFAALLLYAAAIESLQPVIGGAGRTFDWLDMASNFAGVCAGWLLFGLARAANGSAAAR